MKHIPITKAVFDEREYTEIIKPLQSGWVVQGPYVKQFEQLFADFTKSNYAKAVSNCTTALHLALLALGIGKGDKVVVPSFTYVASANAVEYTGAEVVFCDIDLHTFNIDTVQLAGLLAADCSIKAIMPVNLFGLCADLQEIMRLAAAYGVKVVEDSACGFDAWVGGHHSGTIGHVGCFSFHPRKSITTGEGGMLITDDEAIYKTVAQLCDHGASKSDLQRHQEKGGSLLPDFTMRGYNYRMTDFQGALGVCQMQKSRDIMDGRRNIARQYDEALAEITALKTPITPAGYIHGYQSYVCLFTLGHNLDNLTIELIDEINLKRNQVMQRLEEQGIATRQGTHAVHTLGYYAARYNLHKQDFIQAYAADRLSMALPLYAQMTQDEFTYVLHHIHEAMQCVE
ncbi:MULTISPECIES: DegT/DnrJ/EryC1/StrS family aminotransferase [Legionella]|uniref:DegT/DnrJ/EryC1/StrS aminotransferase family protein n=1 Tax=Legionella septentrionalis TaxID=2498109 RepID=A0A433JK38_9GAMM|nr:MULTISPECIES: DegT/DnrJ/EryC1/StrS aminotransferase family protein [Legionella]MCP0914345.1 DegT/DnrJ/EryC1/StrS aminotransferase family protein [Legionella sp. 27cVA30]RUQ88994.1 DegT/DnrJ/EryC1/StrS aminotransferase family protein [Legionella septentrionalis]RUR00301.1 DegT/DnrJ/EryC1/StrS aminotransferase family protein [Legionella septentrionalis]RUR11842.1 DegT/DnrJ/EryC1/StrS aminotransferase family protein [Legionella septentrionalis]RUR17529.1 DegT/DnrJ/EryC1/StrS aminotransferase f